MFDFGIKGRILFGITTFHNCMAHFLRLSISLKPAGVCERPRQPIYQ